MAEDSYPLRLPADQPKERAPERPPRRFAPLSSAIVLGLLAIHGLLCLACQGGWREIASPWPPAWHDHPMHYHNAVVTRTFLARTGTTAGYDPYFMAGYAKSFVSDPSGTLGEVVVALFGRERPAFAYKLYVLCAMAAPPWLVAAAIRLLGGGREALVAGVSLFLVYLWVDFPLAYAGFGMTSFLLVVPLGAVVVGLLAAYIDRGGRGRWLLAALGSSAMLLVHPLGALIVAPAAVATYLGAIIAGRRSGDRVPLGRHVGVVAIPPVMLALNAFWWAPAVVLLGTRDTQGADFFSHPEPVWMRLGQVLGMAEPRQGVIQVVLLGGALVGPAALRRRWPIGSLALGTFIAAGLFWGYLAGAFRAFDFLQPGRNTYAAYTGGAIAGGLGWAAIRRRLARGPGRLDRWATLAVLLIGFRLFVPPVLLGIRDRTGRDPLPSITRGPDGAPRVRFFREAGPLPYLSSRPVPEQAWLIDRLRDHFGPGDRIYYEEGGSSAADARAPAAILEGRRFGGLIPSLTSLEVIGGPFLHVPVRANFTQFGDGRLFGEAEWGREHFVRYAELYRPAGIVCWSPRARGFCRANPDLIEIVAERPPFLIGRVVGFEGDAIRGRAEVDATAGRLEVRASSPDDDGPIVLRYHAIPGLRSRPPAPVQPVPMPGDPVPFLGVPEAPGALRIEWAAPP